MAMMVVKCQIGGDWTTRVHRVNGNRYPQHRQIIELMIAESSFQNDYDTVCSPAFSLWSFVDSSIRDIHTE